LDELEQAMLALGIEIPRAPPGLGSGGAAPYPSYPQGGVSSWLQQFLAALGGVNTQGLPGPVASSVLTQPSYGEGEVIPYGGTIGPAGADALRQEYEGPARGSDRGGELPGQLDMLDLLRRGTPWRQDGVTPFGGLQSGIPYGRPLHPPPQRFPFGLY
jgi:hypothetical protein